jgi:hypothetical protein
MAMQAAALLAPMFLRLLPPPFLRGTHPVTSVGERFGRRNNLTPKGKESKGRNGSAMFTAQVMVGEGEGFLGEVGMRRLRSAHQNEERLREKAADDRLHPPMSPSFAEDDDGRRKGQGAQSRRQSAPRNRLGENDFLSPIQQHNPASTMAWGDAQPTDGFVPFPFRLAHGIIKVAAQRGRRK